MTDNDYSPLSRPAIASGILGGLAVLGLAAPVFVLFALAGIACGVPGLAAVRKYELRGRAWAVAGTSLSILFAVVTPAWHVTRYRMEAVTGHERVDFGSMLQAGANGLAPLSGRKVCLKGYALWSKDDQAEVKSFLLSPDGNRNRPESSVLVELPAGEMWPWEYEALAVSGTLYPNPDANEDDPKSPKYILRLSSVRKSRSPYGLENRSSVGRC
jgi:hypothetical protein